MVKNPTARDARQIIRDTSRDQGIASSPELSVWVSANAGTGKTHVLTNRVLRLLVAGTRPEAILCLTYTKAAAAEMSERVFSRLAEWVSADEERLRISLSELNGRAPAADEIGRARTLFAHAIETPGGLKIQTIHAFAERLLQRFPLEAGVAPGFEILADEDAAALRRQAIDDTLRAATDAPESALGRALSIAIAFAVDDRFDEMLAAALDERDWLREAERIGLDAVEIELRKHLDIGPDATRDGVQSAMAGVLAEADFDHLAGVLAEGSTTDIAGAQRVRHARAAKGERARAAALAEVFLTKTGEPRDRLMTSKLAKAHPELVARLTRAQDRFCKSRRDLVALDSLAATLALYRLAGAVMQRFIEAKARRAALDFDDLIEKTAGLLEEPDKAQWVLFKLDSALSHILVDEAQDTAPSQWRIIEALTEEFFSGQGAHEERRTLFAVGDEKQSIYSFQGAEAEEFERMERVFTGHATASGTPWRTIPLKVSFRTTEPVLEAVDRVFADHARTPGLTATAAKVEHLASRIGQAGLVEIWPIEQHVAAQPGDPWNPLDDETETSVEVRLANRIADEIAGWIRAGERLLSEDRPVTPGDILILLRKRQPLAAPITAALKRRDIPVAGTDRVRLLDHIAVQDLVTLADFLTLPEDDLALASTLKSPMFGLDDDDLLTLAANRKGTLWKALLDAAETDARYRTAGETLKRWRRHADFLPPYEFLAGLLDKDGMRAKLVARLGPDAADVIDELASLALTYDDGEPPSLSGFLSWLRQGEREIKRDMEHGKNEVRVMTVHGAKGLEAPIVILPDTCSTASARSRGGGLVHLEGVMPPSSANPFFWCIKGATGLAPIDAERAKALSRDAAERNRLLYVAMTRARDRLYVTGFARKNGPDRGCWYELIHTALEPVADKVRRPDGTEVLRLASPQTAVPGKPKAGPRELATATVLPKWAHVPAPREPQLTMPLAPSRLAPYEIDDSGDPLVTPAPRPPLAEPPATSGAEVAKPAARPDDSRFLRGTLTHALLQHLPSFATSGRAAAAKAFLAARAQGLSARVQQSIAKETLAVLADPTFAPLFGPASEAEVPIVASIPRPSGSGPALKITGQIDRLAVTGDAVLIVDYKTNRPPPRDPARVADVYLYQLAAYRLAVAQIFPNKPVRAAILWTETASLMEIPVDLLDRFTAQLWTLEPSRLDG